MIRTALRALAGAGVAAAVVLLAPVDTGLVLDVYLLFLGGLLLLTLVAATVRGEPSGERLSLERALARARRARCRPTDLVRLEDQVALAVVTAGDAYLRLRPVLREVASHRLATRHGVDLDTDTGRARALLGDEAWSLVRPDLEPPSDRLGPGLPLDRLRRAVTALERV